MDDTQTQQPFGYVTYDADGTLNGSFFQVLHPDHEMNHIVVPEDVRLNWCAYRANEARNGLELLPPVPADLAALRSAKNAEINHWRAAANLSTFPHAGKVIACDALSRSDIDGVANQISLFGTFPDGFPGAWKAVDNSYIVLPDIDAFKAMYASMTAQGAENFNHAQALKAALAGAGSPEEIAAIVW
jgi:hypothetical protein